MFGMGTGFALVLRFCGTLGHGFIGGAGFCGGTGNGVRFGDGDGGCDGRSGKGGSGLESYRKFCFGFGFPHCAALVKNVHCGVGKAFEAFDRLGFTFQPGVGTLTGLTGGGTGVEIADGGGQVKGIGENEGIKRVQHFRYFLSFHAVLGGGFNRHQWPGRIHPTGQRR